MRKAVFIAAVVLLAGCSRSGNENANTTDTSASATTSSAPAVAMDTASTSTTASTGDNRPRMNPIVPANSDLPAKQAGSIAPAQSRIDLQEYDIRMNDTLPAGPHSFLVNNGGKMQHSLAIEGNGLSAALPEPLTRGDTATLTVDLKPGTYTFYCPVDGHKGRGMSRTITVK
ncbi:MAG TPA: plastocyanin/azurin family copper-binding protein [Thermoanaerobaculia bacterium]|nr:plastocyanin/azurin family copper-binding protein [Thermoanaerobaculia bacterium]